MFMSATVGTRQIVMIDRGKAHQLIAVDMSGVHALREFDKNQQFSDRCQREWLISVIECRTLRINQRHTAQAKIIRLVMYLRP